MRQGCRRLAAIIAGFAAACALVPGVAAGAASGEISRAEATSNWRTASIAGSVEWSGCDYHPPPDPPKGGPSYFPAPSPGPLDCRWLPFVTVGPESASCGSAARSRPDALGTGVSLVWTRAEGVVPGRATFEVGGHPIGGPVDRLVCLSLIATGPQPIVCVTVLGAQCPPYAIGTSFHTLASAVLAPPPSPGPSGSSSGGEGAPQASPPEKAGNTRRQGKRHRGRCAKRGKREASKRAKRCKRSRH